MNAIQADRPSVRSEVPCDTLTWLHLRLPTRPLCQARESPSRQ